MGCGSSSDPDQPTIQINKIKNESLKEPEITNVNQDTVQADDLALASNQDLVKDQQVLPPTLEASPFESNTAESNLCEKKPSIHLEDPGLNRNDSIRRRVKKSRLQNQIGENDDEDEPSSEVKRNSSAVERFTGERHGTLELRKATTLSMVYNTPEKLLKLFEKFSKNGFITPPEFLRFCDKRFREIPKRELLKAFHQADADRSGTIEFDEFETLVHGIESLQQNVRAQMSNQQQAIRTRFDEIDTQGSGHITKEQFFAAILKDYPDFDRESLLQYFEQADTDQSGTIEIDEFAYLMYLVKNRLKALSGIRSNRPGN